MRSSDWPPVGGAAPQWAIWDQIEQSKGRRAVFFVDSLRFDLAKDLANTLAGDGATQVELQARTASLPSITPLGMASLLPDAEKQEVTWEGRWQITNPGTKSNLAEKQARIEFLKTRLSSGHAVELQELLQPQMKITSNTALLLVFSQEIDEVGENASELAFDVLATLIQRLLQGVRKALDAGYETVHIITDHGFLLLGQVPESDKLQVPMEEVLKLGQRYLVGRYLRERSNLLRFKVRGNSDLWGYYPFGIVMFSTPGTYNYSHGGPTLQEAIIPHLAARRSQQQRKVSVRLTMPEQIHNAIFRVELQPYAHNLFDLPRDVSIALEYPPGTRLRESETTVIPTSPVAINLRLMPTDKISRGATITVVLRDAQTAEELDRKMATVQVELEL
jgi:hypothetical protein